MNVSHKQLGLPNFDKDEMIKCLKDLLKIEKAWIPDRPYHSVYIRPTSIAMNNDLALGRVTKSKTFIILFPTGPYFAKIEPLNLVCGTDLVRAWPNGFGDKKVGG